MAKLITAALLNVYLLVAVTADTKPEGLSGFWVLDTAKSRWGQMQKPASVTLEVSHHNGEMRYSGSVVYTNEDTREFTFDGTVGGTEYPTKRSYGSGKLSIVRKDVNTYQTEFKSDNGLFIETSRIVLSADRNVMTRHMSLQSPIGLRSWMEVYRRR